MSEPNSSNSPRRWFPKPYADFVQRLRVAGGFLLLVVFAWQARPALRSLAIGLPVSLIGLWLRGWAAGHLAKDRELATAGPYAYLRNPLYVGTLITALGIVIAAQSLSLAIVFAAVFLLVYLPAVELEEEHLREIFPQYAAYAQRVNRFLPSRARALSGADFSWALYRKNEEFKAAAGWLVAVAWLGWKCWLNARIR